VTIIAVAQICELLATPDLRPGAWEAAHVRALDEPLRHVHAVLLEGLAAAGRP
jgi:hypothetical protein